MRAAGIGGILFVVLSAVIVVVSPFWPPLGATPGELTAYYVEHHTPFLVGNYLAVAAALPSFVQIACLVQLIKRAEGEHGWQWLCVLLSALFAHALGAMALLAYQAVPFEVAAGEPSLAKALSDLAGVSFGCFLIALSGFVGFTSWAALKTQTLPRWFALLGFPLALACLAASAGAIVAEPRWLAGGGLATATVTGVFFGWCFVMALLFLRMKEPAIERFATNVPAA